MAQVKLQAGATLDFLTKGELDQSLASAFDREWTARARGIKPLRFSLAPVAAVSGTAAYVIGQTPNEGYVWALRQLGLTMSASVSVRVGIGDTGTTGPANLLLQNNITASTNPVFQWSGTQALLYPEEYPVLWASGSANVNNWCLYVVEVPAELVWKLV